MDYVLRMELVQFVNYMEKDNIHGKIALWQCQFIVAKKQYELKSMQTCSVAFLSHCFIYQNDYIALYYCRE